MDKLGQATVEITSQPTKTSSSSSTGMTDLDVLISVQPPQTTQRLPVDVVCVIDNSGSMSDSASIKNADGKTESHGLNLLDIVVHGVKTIIAALEPEDRIGIVTFESQVRVLRELTKIGDKPEPLKKLDDDLNLLRPMGSTSLWGGLTKGIELLTKNKTKGRVASLVLLTDGSPTDKQPEEIVKSLAELKKGAPHYGQLPTLNSFGFGYSIKSDMLLDIAKIGNGTYSFIPDAGFVGTTFVNCTANSLCMFSPVVTLEIKSMSGTRLKSSPHMEGNKVELGSLQFGQPRDFVVQVSIDSTVPEDKPYLEVVAKYEVFGAKTNEVAKITAVATHRGKEPSPAITAHVARWALIDYVESALENRKGKSSSSGKDKDTFAQLLPLIPESLPIHQDLTGQITEAFSEAKYFDKWGKHYIPSLLRAHRLQQCNNFKDPGVQEYGGKLFSGIRDALDDKFLSIPPPVPKQSYGYGSSSSSSSSAPASYSMSAYYSSSAPCFSGECQVQKWNDTIQTFQSESLSNLRRGDIVVGDHGKGVRIECILQTNSANGEFDLVELSNGLIVTPWHPVRQAEGEEWRFPAEIGKVESKRKCKAVYSFVVEAGKSYMEINGWQCVSLGHGRRENEVVKHEYWGSEKVVEDLRRMRGWSLGKIEMKEGGMVRGENGLVCGMKAEMEEGARVVAAPDN